MSNTLGGTDIVGGYPTAMGGMGGIGGVGLIGLIGLNSFLGRDGFGLGAGGAAVAGTTVLEQNVSELRKDVQGVNTTVHALGNELQASLAQQTLGQTGEFRNLDNRLCDSEKAALQTGYALSLQGFQNTQQITNMLTAFQTSNDAKFCNLENAIHADGDATRALITQNLIDGLRAELSTERRSRDNREIEINVNQSNQQTQQVLQNQMQQQGVLFANALNSLGDQFNRATNSIVNLGSGAVVSPQSNSNANTRVNS